MVIKDEKGEIVNKYYPLVEKLSYINDCIFRKLDNEILFVEDMRDSIFSLRGDKLTPRYFVDYKDKSMSKVDRKSILKRTREPLIVQQENLQSAIDKGFKYWQKEGLLTAERAEELKNMIKTGETITIEAIVLDQVHLREIRSLPHVFDVSYEEQILQIRCGKAKHNLVRVLNYLQGKDIVFGKVFSELPTLNDVFLEITGKALRD